MIIILKPLNFQSSIHQYWFVHCLLAFLIWVRLHKNTLGYGGLSANALCVPVDVFKAFFPVLFTTFSPDLSLIAPEEIPQSTGNGYRKSHCILIFFNQLGPAAGANSTPI